METRAVEEKCKEPSEEEKELYTHEKVIIPDVCCPSFVRTSCLLDGVPFQVLETLCY